MAMEGNVALLEYEETVIERPEFPCKIDQVKTVRLPRLQLTFPFPKGLQFNF